MAKKKRSNTSTREPARPRRWTKSVAKKVSRLEFTTPLKLSGVHPDQLLDKNYGFHEYNKITPAQPGKYTPPSDPLNFITERSFVLPDEIIPEKPKTPPKTPCAARHQRREVLFATNRTGGNRAKTPKSTQWKDPC